VKLRLENIEAAALSRPAVKPQRQSELFIIAVMFVLAAVLVYYLKSHRTPASPSQLGTNTLPFEQAFQF
jgi:hypothetical protein